MTPFEQFRLGITRRHFLSAGSHLLGTAALASLAAKSSGTSIPGISRTNFPAKAKHVIYLHMVGGPPQMDLFDYKSTLGDWYDKDLPETVRMGQRLTTMTSGQARFP